MFTKKKGMVIEVRISRNYMSALMAANKGKSSSRKRMTNSLLSTNKYSNRYNTQTNKTTGTNAATTYMNMKDNAGKLQSAANKLLDTGDNSIYAKAEESGDTNQITRQVKEFVNQYNSTVRDLKSAGGRVDTSYYNQMTSYASMYRNALEASGVTRNSDGTLSVNENALKKASVEQLKQTWGGSSSFAARAGQVATNVQYNAVTSMNSMINNSYSSLLRNFGASGGFFNFWS